MLFEVLNLSEVPTAFSDAQERIASGMSAENVNVLKDRLEGMKARAHE